MAASNKSESKIIGEEPSKQPEQSIMNNHQTKSSSGNNGHSNKSDVKNNSTISGGGGNKNSKKKGSGRHHEKKREQLTNLGHVQYRNLDEWLENSIKGVHINNDQDSPASSSYNINQNIGSSFQPFNPLSSYAPRRPTTDPWMTMMPPELVRQ